VTTSTCGMHSCGLMAGPRKIISGGVLRPSKVVAKCVKQCKKDEELLCFWMRVDDAQEYEGESVCSRLLDALN